MHRVYPSSRCSSCILGRSGKTPAHVILTPLSIRTNLKQDEDWRAAVSRAVYEELGPAMTPPVSDLQDAASRVSIDEGSIVEREEATDSRSYPGLACIYMTISVVAGLRGVPTDVESFEVRIENNGLGGKC